MLRTRWPAFVALAAAALLSGGFTASAHAANSAVTRTKAHLTCSASTVTGRLTDCPRVSATSPSGSRDKTTVAATPSNLAALVDTRTWTSGGGNTFPGADVPYGMVQWSPDTSPDRSDGGGYTYGDEALLGYSLTHISGPGCGAAGDVPILPMTGAFPSDLTDATTSFTNAGEVAQAGYYSAQSNAPDTVTSKFAETRRSAMGAFTYPQTTQADMLVKLMDSQNPDTATSAKVVGKDEIEGSVTSGDFCGENEYYTLYFDIAFDHPFTAAHVVTASGAKSPAAVELTFDTTSVRTVQAKVGISYVSDANALLDRQTENPGWNFGTVKKAAQESWNDLLGRIKVSGGSYAETQEFYSLLYKDFIQPNVTSDVNGQYMGADDMVHTLAKGQKAQYGIYSGWDIYHSLSQLQAMLDPAQAGDMVTSQLDYYAQNGLLQQWGYLNEDNYVMVGDPTTAIIADAYAFGARNFDTKTALKDMLAQADTVNDVRPGEALEARYGYLPENGTYGCCNAHGFASSLLEYDNADFALSQYANDLGDTTDATALEARANNWANIFDTSTDLLTPRLSSGAFVAGVGPTTTNHYVEGDAYEYLWDVPNDYAGLFSLLGGDAKVAPELRTYLSEPDGFGMYAQLTNEFDLGEQYALDYAGDPAGTQQAVNNIRYGMYLPGPSGLANNDDLGANSSNFIWEMLGMYPENPGSGTLVFNSPGFPHASISLPSGRTITINAPGTSPTRYYVDGLKINGTSHTTPYTGFTTLAKGATLDWTLGTKATGWASASAPPSYGPTFTGTAAVSPGSVTLEPGASATVDLRVTSLGSAAQTVSWSASGTGGVTADPASGTLSVPAGGTATAKLTITAGATITSNGLAYTWPDVPAGAPDAISAGGQTIPFASASGATRIGFIGSATNGPSSGTVTVTYTDGTTSTATLALPDWTLNAGGGTAPPGTDVVADTSYRNGTDGTMQQVATYLFSVNIPITSGKTVASVTLPATLDRGSIGIFDITSG
jgi:predicted alpha-1,2-mannosidase